MDFNTRFLPPDAFDDNPPICDDCDADREDCGPNCEKMAQFLREREDNIRKVEAEHPIREDQGLDERWEREI